MPADITPSFATNTLFHQFQTWNKQAGAPEALAEFIDMRPVHGRIEHYPRSEFMHWCAEQGFAPEHWPSLWAAFDASDGQRDDLFLVREKKEQSGQIKQINQAINSVLDPDNNGFIDAAEYRAASGHEMPQTRVLPADAQDSAYRLNDLNGDGTINGSDQTLWDARWAETHGGSFYAAPQNGARRAAAIADNLAAQGKTFNLFGEAHELHPWQEIGAAIRAFKATGAPVIYAVEADAKGLSQKVAPIIAELERNPAILQDPSVFQRAVEAVRAVSYLGGDKFDRAYSMVMAVRDGAHVAFIDVDPLTAAQWNRLAAYGVVPPADVATRDRDPVTGQRLPRDPIMAQSLLQLAKDNPDAKFVVSLGMYHASASDHPPELRDDWTRVDCRPLARVLKDHAPDAVWAMNFSGTENILSDEGDAEIYEPGVFDAQYTLPVSSGINVADSWLAAGWPVR